MFSTNHGEICKYISFVSATHTKKRIVLASNLALSDFFPAPDMCFDIANISFPVEYFTMGAYSYMSRAHILYGPFRASVLIQFYMFMLPGWARTASAAVVHTLY